MENRKENGYNIICGRNPVLEAVRSGREIDRLLVAHGVNGGSVTAIIAKCKTKGILIKEVSSQKLDYYCGGANHQGVAVLFAEQEYCQPQDILDYAKEKGEMPFIIICDGIEDPHNLGAIIRTAEAAGVHGIIIPKRRSASLNATVAKSASGALEYMKVARVTNISNTIDFLKENGVWVYAADMDGSPHYKTDLRDAAAIVLGSEGFGISRLVKEKCDFVISIPLYGQVNSMNVSAAAAVILCEAARQRRDA